MNECPEDPFPPMFFAFCLPFSTQIDVCLMLNLQNPFVGTVHILTDYPDALVPRNGFGCDHGANETARDAAAHCVDDSENGWAETDWRPPVVRGLEAELAGENAGTKKSQALIDVGENCSEYLRFFMVEREPLVRMSARKMPASEIQIFGKFGLFYRRWFVYDRRRSFQAIFSGLRVELKFLTEGFSKGWRPHPAGAMAHAASGVQSQFQQ